MGGLARASSLVSLVRGREYQQCSPKIRKVGEVWCTAEPAMVGSEVREEAPGTDTIADVSGCGEGLGPESFGSGVVVEHGPYQVEERAVVALRNTVLLRSVRDGELMVNPVVVKVATEVGGCIFTAIIGAEGANGGR